MNRSVLTLLILSLMIPVIIISCSDETVVSAEPDPQEPDEPAVTQAEPPEFSPEAGTFTDEVTITMESSTPGATIYYTIDEGTPGVGSLVYEEPLVMDESATIRAIAVADDYEESSMSVGIFKIEYSRPGEVVEDIDGNIYRVVQIGDHFWMAENLRTTQYRDGTEIPRIITDQEWTDASDGAYTVYAHGEYPVETIHSEREMIEAYGKLYNWYAATHDKGICPDGWRMPDQDDWNRLFQHGAIDGTPQGNKFKDCRQQGSELGGDCDTDEHPRWNVTDNGVYGTDDFGFSGLPAGYRHANGSFIHGGFGAHWWTETPSSPGHAELFTLQASQSRVSNTGREVQSGRSVRCIARFSEESN
jgi:uncharacterized protein (TIGR02145 family)